MWQSGKIKIMPVRRKELFASRTNVWLAAWMAPLLSILFAIAAPAASAIPVHWNRTVQSRAAATPIVPAKSGAQNAGYLNRYGWSACIGKSDAPGARQNRIATGLVLGTYVPGVSCTAYPAQYGQQTIVSVRPANSHFGRDPPVRLQPSTVYDGSTRYDGTSGFSLAAESTGTSVIGHYPDYVNMAKDLKANYFSIPTEQWNAMSETERWAANQKFLDEAAARGSTFRLATSLSEMKKGSYFAREVQYLKGLGYTISKDGTTLIPPAKP